MNHLTVHQKQTQHYKSITFQFNPPQRKVKEKNVKREKEKSKQASILPGSLQPTQETTGCSLCVAGISKLQGRLLWPIQKPQTTLGAQTDEKQ